MCFRFESCFGVHVHDDDDYHYGPSPASSKAVQPRHATIESTHDGGYYGSNNGHRAQQQGLHRGNAGHHTAAYRHQQPAAHADDEAGGRRKQPSPARAVADMDGRHRYAAGEAFKRPATARNDRVAAHGAANGAHYHHYPAATDTSDHGRY